MALIGNLGTSFGLNASYHNINFFSWDKTENLLISVSSFLDEATRLNNDNPLIRKIFVFSNVLNNAQLSFAEMYAMLKTLPEFSTMADG